MTGGSIPHPDDDPARFLTTTEAARRLRRSQRFVLDELRQKRLRGAKIGSAWSIDPADLETYIQARMNMSRVRRPTEGARGLKS